MITILHAGVVDRELLVWAERSIDTATTSNEGPSARGRGAARIELRAHPFAATLEQIEAALAALGGSFARVKPRRRTRAQPKRARPRRAPATTVIDARDVVRSVWLPTYGGAPAPSSPLLGELPATRAKPSLAPWTVEYGSFDADAAIELLSCVADQRTLASGIVVGTDLAFWARTLRFAGDLVARQRFVPSVAGSPAALRAVWQPVLGPDDQARLTQLVAQMPPAARAWSESELTAPACKRSAPARSLVESLLGAWVDQLVRSSIADAELASAPTRVATRLNAARFHSTHDHWLHALGTADGHLELSAADASALAQQVDAWRRPLAHADAAPYRLCLRLEEPGTHDTDEDEAPRRALNLRDGRDHRAAQAAWYVRFLVQPADDPSLLVPAEEVWKTRGRKLASLRRGDADVRTFVLAALGQAATLCPQIRASLDASAPAGHALDVAGAHAFLTERSLVLEEAGFRVLLPAWWTRRGTKQRVVVRAHVPSSKLRAESQLSLRRIVSFDWQVALQGETMTLKELEQLARLKAPLVQRRGQWIEINPEEIRAAIDFWKKHKTQKIELAGLVRLALGAEAPGVPLPFEGVTAEGAVGELLARLEGHRALTAQAMPTTFCGTLRPYQARGYAWLAFLRELGLGACLADDMGLGKTVQTLALLMREREQGERRPVLLVCPTSVVQNWQHEATRFAPELSVLVHHGVGRAKGASFRREASKHGLVVSSYGLLHRDLTHFEKVDWAGVVLDEAQNIKNASTQQSHAARKLSADYRIALTGTPVENHVGDLWSIMEFLNPGWLGTQTAFRKRFLLPIQSGRDPDAADRLRRITSPFVLRRLKSDRAIIADLPDKLESQVYCTLTREQASLYRAITREAEASLRQLDGMKRKGVILATLSKLKQVCNHPAQLLGDGSALAGRSGKLARLTEMLGEVLSVGDRALVFSQFSEMGGLLKRHLQEVTGQEVLFLHGGVTRSKRDQMIRRFQDKDGPQIFLLSLKAGGTGLNLTRANHVFHFDRWWNPAVENQATDRAFRIGQTRSVQVHKFVCAGTCEEAIAEMIERKQKVADRVVSNGESWLTELSNAELRKVFELRSSALGD